MRMRRGKGRRHDAVWECLRNGRRPRTEVSFLPTNVTTTNFFATSTLAQKKPVWSVFLSFSRISEYTTYKKQLLPLFPRTRKKENLASLLDLAGMKFSWWERKPLFPIKVVALTILVARSVEGEDRHLLFRTKILFPRMPREHLMNKEWCPHRPFSFPKFARKTARKAMGDLIQFDAIFSKKERTEDPNRLLLPPSSPLLL